MTDTPEIYTRIGNKHFLTGPDFFAESEDGTVWIRRDPDQASMAYALAQYEQARLAPRPKPKFWLSIDADHFHARPSRATIGDAIFVAIATATWLALLTSIYLVFK